MKLEEEIFKIVSYNAVFSHLYIHTEYRAHDLKAGACRDVAALRFDYVSNKRSSLRHLVIPKVQNTMHTPRSIHKGENGLYILDDVNARVFTSAKIWYYRMQWPTPELVFPRFPTLLLLIKKRTAPDTHGLAISVIYGTDSISSMAYPV
jgi:hypothetical protein